MDPLRLFLALWPPPPAVAQLQALQQAWGWPAGAAPVPAQRLHLTLQFLGAVPPARLPALEAALPPAGEPCRLEAAQPRCWPGGLAVLELAAPPRLQALHAALARALQALELPVDARPWRPHVTLARRVAPCTPPAPAGLPPWDAWAVDGGYALVASGAQGYRTLRAVAPC